MVEFIGYVIIAVFAIWLIFEYWNQRFDDYD